MTCLARRFGTVTKTRICQELYEIRLKSLKTGVISRKSSFHVLLTQMGTSLKIIEGEKRGQGNASCSFGRYCYES